MSRPEIIAHRGGPIDFPENTIEGFERAYEEGVRRIELDVQVTSDNKVILYHPRDLDVRTNGTGAVSTRDLGYIQTLDAAYTWGPGEGYPYRGKGIRVPTLQQVLQEPALADVHFIVDMKSLPAADLVNALKTTLTPAQLSRITFYSTNTEHLDLLRTEIPTAVMFESRDTTRQRLLEILASDTCAYPTDSPWIGYELEREMQVTEYYALGNGTSAVNFRMWTPESMCCVRDQAKSASIVFFGIDDCSTYAEVGRLGADAVLSNSPATLEACAADIEPQKSSGSSLRPPIDFSILLGRKPHAVNDTFSGLSPKVTPLIESASSSVSLISLRMLLLGVNLKLAHWLGYSQVFAQQLSKLMYYSCYFTLKFGEQLRKTDEALATEQKISSSLSKALLDTTLFIVTDAVVLPVLASMLKQISIATSKLPVTSANQLGKLVSDWGAVASLSLLQWYNRGFYQGLLPAMSSFAAGLGAQKLLQPVISISLGRKA